ncbi:uncharacterized protein V6R79_011300 [Siganus canaliculatus]
MQTCFMLPLIQTADQRRGNLNFQNHRSNFCPIFPMFIDLDGGGRTETHTEGYQVIHKVSVVEKKNVCISRQKLFICLAQMTRGDFISANDQLDEDVTAAALTERLDQIRSHSERMREMSSPDPE